MYLMENTNDVYFYWSGTYSKWLIVQTWNYVEMDYANMKPIDEMKNVKNPLDLSGNWFYYDYGWKDMKVNVKCTTDKPTFAPTEAPTPIPTQAPTSALTD